MSRLAITLDSGTHHHDLTEDPVTIGRSAENMIQIDDPSVSGRHAQLHRAGETYLLKDLGSTNGTRVNGNNITEKELRPGDRLRFGKVEARIESELAGDSVPLPASVEIEAKPAEVSEKPADFANASPFPKRQKHKDATRTAILAAAALAILAFALSMFSLLSMHAPTP
jgi:pSer/pThr/pTyr-binding forkhead associated (FHA) protein